MNVILAVKTISAIDNMIKADQGAKFRGFLQQVIPHMADAYRTEEESFRNHLGASQIGSECGRAIWYNFRWATKSNHEGRMVRLFNRGHLEEARFIAMLLMIGCQIYQQDENGKQYRILWAEGHAGGSGDGIALGIPDLPAGVAALTEFKTHNDKSFADLKAKGVRIAKFEHYGQMNCYMGKFGLPVALYLAVNKNTDELYGEIVPYDDAIAKELLQRGERLVWMTTPPVKIAQTPGYWKCRFCDHKPVCHNKAAPHQNCRTCEFSEPRANAVWFCTNAVCRGPIPKDLQITGCSHYEKKVEF